MDFQVIDVDLFNKPEDIAIINPYNRVPVLVDRDLVLYESNIINEYIDERFPHPQLMPPDPIMRGPARQLLFTMERELFSYIDALEKNLKSADKARMQMRDRLTELAPMFNKQKFMLGDDFSMLDVAIAPLLWRLDHYGIELPKTAAPLMKYAERIFFAPGLHRRADAVRKDDARPSTPAKTAPAWLSNRKAPRLPPSTASLQRTSRPSHRLLPDAPGYSASSNRRVLFDDRQAIRYTSHLVGQVAQLVEQRTENPRVRGSIPRLATKNKPLKYKRKTPTITGWRSCMCGPAVRVSGHSLSGSAPSL
jgi:RNA polymerase-associated protein